MRPALRAAAALILLAALVPIGAAAAGEPLAIRIGWVVVPTQLTPVLFENRAVLRHYGTGYVVDPVHFSGTSPQIAALATGELDIAALAYSSFGAAIENARMDDLRIVADVVQDGVDGYYSNEFMVRQDSPIRTIEDLKGKVLATNGIGGAVDVAIRNMLRRHGLEDRRDYTMVEAQFPNLEAMLLDRKVDLISLVLPFSRAAKAGGQVRVLFTQREALGGPTQVILWAARRGFLEKNRAALEDFFEDVARALRWYLDPANRAAAIGIVARYTKRPPAFFADWLFTRDDYYRDPAARPNLAALQQNLRTERELGFRRTDIDVTKYADLRFVEEAARRLAAEAPGGR